MKIKEKTMEAEWIYYNTVYWREWIGENEQNILG